MFVDPLKVAEALQARGRAHSHDNNWDDATRDYREALSLTQQVRIVPFKQIPACVIIISIISYHVYAGQAGVSSEFFRV
jgi:hypothetical protein